MSAYLYTKDHEWALREGDSVKVGISDFAQKELGDIAYVELPEVDKELRKGEAACAIDSLKSSSEIFAPVSGKIVEINEKLENEENCGIINQDPLGEGWIFRIEMIDSTELNDLLSDEEYQEFIKEF